MDAAEKKEWHNSRTTMLLFDAFQPVPEANGVASYAMLMLEAIEVASHALLTPVVGKDIFALPSDSSGDIIAPQPALYQSIHVVLAY